MLFPMTKIVTIERDEERADLAQNNIYDNLAIEDQITLVIGRCS